ncbi:MAG TPA: HAMP domain-containing sensor histidine kinase [Pyrinomonadaceae bacterium]|jgi:signal transduction histidine kinase|nr:HAMP domain-containing sensor histidine kinase [Pyrinomonadaceae bacterium]
MSKLRAFFKRHVLLVGLAAVVVPLLSIIGLQYWSLRKLEKTSIVAGTVGMKNYLGGVSSEVKMFYKSNSEQALAVPAYSVEGDNLCDLKDHFPVCKVEGAKLVFLAGFDEKGEAQTLFFNPQDLSAHAGEVPPAEARAVQFATAPLRMARKENVSMPQPMVWMEDHDPDNFVLIKAVTDDQKVVGATGMILDPAYFRDVVLPAKIKESLAKYFPDGTDTNVIVTAYDEHDNPILSSQNAKGQNDEIKTTLPYFYNYKVGIRSRHMTPEQWAHWNFNYSLSLSLLLTAVLIGGIVLALRTASREMRLSQMKADFVSNVSHELRTPLASIRVFGEFMKLGRVADHAKIREYGEHIETESRRLTQLINNILDFSKIESGRKTYEFERVQLEEVVAETLKTCEVRLKQSGFSIVFQPPARTLPAGIVDRDAIAQALLNLLDNAVKYSEQAEKKEVLVGVGERDGCLQISVTDHGIGIAPAEQKKIFEKFYRVSTGLVHDVKGSGLGLALVKHIVEAHRGTMTVESVPGYGSTFTISLAAADGVADRAETQKPLLGGDAPDLALNKSGV